MINMTEEILALKKQLEDYDNSLNSQPLYARGSNIASAYMLKMIKLIEKLNEKIDNNKQ